MNQTTNKRFITKKKIASWSAQILLFVAIFLLISWWQQRDMLSTMSDNASPGFSLVSMNNQVLQFDPSSQNKPTLIYFFAPWCSVCHASIDNIEAIKQSAPNKANYYIIALDWNSKQQVEEFLLKHSLSIPVLLGTQQTQAEFKIRGFPSYYVVGKNGRLLSKDLGYTTELGMRIRLGIAED